MNHIDQDVFGDGPSGTSGDITDRGEHGCFIVKWNEVAERSSLKPT